MLHLFITEALGAELLEHLRAEERFAGVVRELEKELSPAALALPCDEIPVLSVFYRGSVVDWYHEGIADQMFADMEEARQRRRQERAASLPLLADLEELEESKG